MQGNSILECVRCGRMLEIEIENGSIKTVWGGSKHSILQGDEAWEFVLCSVCLYNRVSIFNKVKVVGTDKSHIKKKKEEANGRIA